MHAKLTEKHEDGFMILEGEGRVFELDLAQWGNASVFMDGSQIPCARIWDIVLDALEKNTRVSRELLFEEAKRASMYGQDRVRMLIWTETPDKFEDEHIKGNVYWRRDYARKRPLVEEFDLVMARLDPSDAATPENFLELAMVAEEQGLFPVAGSDNKYMFAPSPQRVYDALHCQPSDWAKIMKMARRPGRHGHKVDLSSMIPKD